jgi:RimJ/RimL family protein N-acetyltransferase
MLMATGIAFHLRRQGGQLADQMHARVVRDARAREGGPVLLIAGVHESNEASKRALGRAGMVRQPTLEETLRASVDLAGHEVWLVAID